MILMVPDEYEDEEGWGDEEEEETGEKTEETEEEEKEKKVAYVCNVCKAMFKEGGMCPNCDVVLKKRGE